MATFRLWHRERSKANFRYLPWRMAIPLVRIFNQPLTEQEREQRKRDNWMTLTYIGLIVGSSLILMGIAVVCQMRGPWHS